MKSIAVIGHGLTPKGKQWGRNIDKHIVVRMWNYHWQNLKDYGHRYDFGFYEISPTEMARFYKHNIHFPVKSWVAAKLSPYTGELPKGPTVYLEFQQWIQDALDLGGSGENNKHIKLTRGVRAAAWAISQRPRRVILVGFDNVKAGTGLTIEEGWPAEYVACPAGFPFRNYVGGSTKYSSHDYAVEGPLLALLAEREKVELVHAQDIWK